MLRRFTSVCFLFATLAGCASSADTTGAAHAEMSEACSAQVTALDTAASQAPSDGSYDAVLAVTSPSCGSTFHTAGPSALSPRHLVRIGSITKSFVSVVVLMLAGEGKIALDGPLRAALPEAPAPIQSVTIRQLLQHTSGIFNYTNTEEFWTAYEKDPFQHYAPADLVALGLAKPPVAAPGERWSYSNTNYVLLGMVIEKVTGEPVAKVIRDRILAPNDLRETFLEGSEPVGPDLPLAPGFDTDGTDVSHAYALDWAWAAGAMVATPSDAARFVTLLGTGALLPAAMQAELVRGVPTTQPGLSYGLGVFLVGGELTGGAGPAIGHGGDIMGFHSLGLHFTEKGTTIFGAVNSDRGAGNDVLVKALDALFPLSPAPRAGRRLPRRSGARALDEL